MCKLENDIQKFIELFYYDPEDGELYKYSNGANTVSKTSTGYHTVTINNIRYRKHKIIYAIHHGYIPKIIDHKDRNKDNNRIENLREANHSLNEANTGPRKNNTTGYKGVNCYSNKYRATLKGKHLGFFNTPKEAAIAYNKAAIKAYGEFAYLNEV